MANIQIDISENGKKTLATAGKYCDRNIDINVDVKGKPTQFTNILDLPTTIVKKGYRVASSSYIETSDGVAIIFPVTAGTHKIRVRGPWILQYHVNSTDTSGSGRTNFYESNGTPTIDTFNGKVTYNHDTGGYINQDVYGDFYFEHTVSKDCYIGFTLKDESVVYPNGRFDCEPIITIDEPIGNGGGW